jgi:hypothetical protein
MCQWLPKIDSFREAIWNKLLEGIINETMPDGSVIQWEVYLPLEYFRVFGWLDDTDIKTNRPRPGTTVDTERQRLIDTQQAFYNRYFRGHGYKAQVVHLPNGMIGSIYLGPLHHNDNGMQNLSGLNPYLVSILEPLYYNGSSGVYPCLYGDRIFATLATIIGPYQNPNHPQEVINRRFSSLREDVEHKFCQVFNLYQVLRASWRFNLFFSGEFVCKLFFVCLFVSNCYTCFNESRNRRFGLRAPTIQQYLPLDEVLDPAPELEPLEGLGTIV